jgi:ferrous iron transport protein B
MADFTVALAGNPNAGKSTIFNALTGAHQHVGNWPGKTVDKKQGKILYPSQTPIVLVDLPGTYSLSAFSIEEIIARDFIVEQHPDAVVAVVDATNLERNLYLVIQLLEMQVPLVLVLNMSDIAEKRRIAIDENKLTKTLGVPVLRVVGHKALGVDQLKTHLQTMATHRPQNCPNPVFFNPMLETAIAELVRVLETEPSLRHYPTRWLAIKVLENDSSVLANLPENSPIHAVLSGLIARIEAETGENPEILIADGRYQFIGQVVQTVINRPAQTLQTASDKLDVILTHRIWGIPIFFMMMWLVFQFTAHVSSPYVDWLDGVINGPLVRGLTWVLQALALQDTWIESLMIDGIVASVGGILVFMPVLLFLYFAIAVLEDSGYMARAAFLMDRLMNALGMHGKSFLPLIIGFGCTVPAIYATRTLENEQDRKLTAFLTTFMSCGARLPVYVLFGTAFFGTAAGNLIFSMYLLGISIAIFTSLVLNRVLYRGKPPAPFVMELPPYRLPHMKSVAINMWQRTVSFIRKAGTVILAASVSVWLLLAIPVRAGGFADTSPEDSLFGTASATIAPTFAPAGFGDWRASGALITGLVAKEVIVSSMSQVYTAPLATENDSDSEDASLEDDIVFTASSFGEATILTVQELLNIGPRTLNLLPGIRVAEFSLLSQENASADEDYTKLEAALQGHFSPLAALAFSVFVLLYVPCITTLSAMRHEFGTRWMWTQIAYTLGIAWVCAVVVYQVGSLIEWIN